MSEWGISDFRPIPIYPSEVMVAGDKALRDVIVIKLKQAGSVIPEWLLGSDVDQAQSVL